MRFHAPTQAPVALDFGAQPLLATWRRARLPLDAALRRARLPLEAAWRRLRLPLAFVAAMTLAACGGGYAEVVATGGPPPVAGLELVLTQVDVDAVQVDWSHDPAAASYVVVRDGYTLAQTRSETLVDASVFPGFRYCYQVTGYDPYGAIVSVSSTGCISVL